MPLKSFIQIYGASYINFFYERGPYFVYARIIRKFFVYTKFHFLNIKFISNPICSAVCLIWEGFTPNAWALEKQNLIVSGSSVSTLNACWIKCSFSFQKKGLSVSM